MSKIHWKSKRGCSDLGGDAAANRWLLSWILPVLFLGISLFNPVESYAQGTTVTGIVRGTNGEPLAEVSITVKGTAMATSTDANGTYSITVPSATSVLTFSSVGYATKDQPKGTGNAMDITMATDAASLGDVVEVGYGTRRKEIVTGSVAQVSAKAFRDWGPVSNPMSALQGQVPGLIITRSSAAPGREGWNFNIRGTTSVNGAQPLVIVDGITLVSTAALNSINPNDIESISFLKDAAAAIYGARAAGGVVLITTKKAKSGKPVIQYDGSVSKKIIGLLPELLNVKQFGQGLAEALTNDFNGVAPTANIWYKMGQLMQNAPDSGWLDMNVQYTMDWATGKLTYVGTPVAPAANGANPGFGDVKDVTFFNTNWIDKLWGDALSTQHTISLSGRSDKAGYRLSLGYLDDGSLLQWGANSSRRYNVRLAHDYNFSKKLKVETNVSLEKNDIIQPTQINAVMGQYQQPGFPVIARNGQPYAWGTQYSPNWLAELGGEQKEYNTRIYTNMKMTFAFTKHLRFVGTAGYNWNVTDLKEQQKPITNWYNYAGYQKGSPDNPTQANSYYLRTLTKDPYYNLNGYIEYRDKFYKAHEVGLTLGSNYERDEFNTYTARANNQASVAVPSLSLGLGDPATKSVTESQSHFAIGSYFGRFNYGYKRKYLLEAQGRYDGTSRLAPANRWQFFYGFSGGWRISQERFMQNARFVNELKLRLSWSSVGNQNGIGLFDYIQLLSIQSNTTGATNSAFPIIGTSPVVHVGPTATVASPARTWENIETQNAGIDFTVWNRRLTGSFDYFIKDNVNMLLPQVFPSVLGATAPTLNLGHLRSWGWEATLGWRDQAGPVTYFVGGTLTDNKNKVINNSSGRVMGQGFNTAVEGYPVGSYFGLEYAGRIQDENTRNAYRAYSTSNIIVNGVSQSLALKNNIGMPVTSFKTDGTLSAQGVRLGDNMFADKNGDGRITVPEDLVYLGRDDPRYAFAVNLGVECKGVDFAIIFQGVGERTIFREGNWKVPFGSVAQGQTNFWWGNTWTPGNPDAFYPNISAGQNATTYNSYNYQVSTWSVENGAYIRLKNLVLGYTIPARLTKMAYIQRLRVYFSGFDLWEKHHIRDQWDPEATRSVGRANNESVVTRYPFFRYLTAGVNLTF